MIVADLLTDRRPGSDVIVRHATGEAWLKIGSFKPAGWEAACDEESRQQEAEERRLLYVALTRARDHLVIPCFPDKRKKAWLDDAIAGFAVDGREPRAARPAAWESHSEAFGRMVHQLLALPDGASADLSAPARTLAPQLGLGDEEAARAAELATRARDLPEIAAVASADLVYRELPFAVPIDGVLTTGRIDLAYRMGGEWTVIEFKTVGFTDQARALEVYGPQLGAYGRALAAVTDAPVRAALCLLGSAELVAFE